MTGLATYYTRGVADRGPPHGVAHWDRRSGVDDCGGTVSDVSGTSGSGNVGVNALVFEVLLTPVVSDVAMKTGVGDVGDDGVGRSRVVKKYQFIQKLKFTHHQ